MNWHEVSVSENENKVVATTRFFLLTTQNYLHFEYTDQRLSQFKTSDNKISRRKPDRRLCLFSNESCYYWSENQDWFYNYNHHRYINQIMFCFICFHIWSFSLHFPFTQGVSMILTGVVNTWVIHYRLLGTCFSTSLSWFSLVKNSSKTIKRGVYRCWWTPHWWDK